MNGNCPRSTHSYGRDLRALVAITALVLGAIGCSGDKDPETTPADAGITDTGIGADISTDVGTDAATSDTAGTDTTVATDAGTKCPGDTGCECKEDKDCTNDGACAMGADGKSTCAAPCKEDKDCTDAVCADVSGKKVCVDGAVALCSPCSKNADCAAPGAKDAACVATGAQGSFCSVGCSADADCTTGYACKDVKDVDGKDAKQCIPKDAKTCACSGWAKSKKLTTTCYADGKPGCTGSRTCGDSGLTACDAAAGKAESCDGTDSDCDGTVDNGVVCDDKNPCTKDSCDGKNGCKSTNDDAGKCDDGNKCTDKDACKDGKCGGAATICNDANPCTDDSCDKAKGCVTLPNKATCDDANACTDNDGCAVSLCQGVTKTCDDKNACTDDSCDPKKGCIFLDNKVACDDGDSCTEKGKCDAGKCSSSAKDCDDKNPCTTDVCDAKTGCKSLNNLKTCDDGDMCTSGDRCKAGKCGKGNPKCVDGKVCTLDACDAKTGKCTYGPAKDGLACSDGKKCTPKDACAKGVCVGTGSSCDDGDICTKDTCNESTGGCSAISMCDDGNACTSDACDAKTGKCSAAPIADCGKTPFGLPYAEYFNCTSEAAKLWTFSGTKAPGWGIDQTPALPKAVTEVCTLNFNDGKAYTCPTGVTKLEATATSPKIDLTKATAPTLTFKYSGSWETSSTYEKMQVQISVDGAKPVMLTQITHTTTSSWSTGKVDLTKYKGKTVQLVFYFWTLDCIANSGSGPFIDEIRIDEPVVSVCNSAANCDDGKPCTTDTCDAKTGKCAHADKAVGPCDDGSKCTTNKKCDGKGACTGGAAKCDDGNGCTSDYCSSTTGNCSYTLGTGTCNDGNLCTAGDKCADGICFAGKPGSCDDGNSCTADSCDAKTGLCAHKATAGCVPSCKTNADCGDGNPCTIDACDTKTSKCTTTTAADGAVCGASSTCTKGACAPIVVTGWATGVRSGDYSRTTCAMHADGTASCWGDNANGQLADGTTTNSGKPLKVKGLATIADLSVGQSHICALHKDGTVSCWGDNYYGQLGDGTTTDNKVVTKVAGLADITAIAAGRYQTCALNKSKRVFCWGRNTDGEIGQGNTGSNYKKPTEVKGLTDVMSISAGGYGACAIRSDKTVWCWGQNTYYRLAGGDDVTTTSDLTLATKDDRYSNVTSVSMGYYNKCVTLSSGSVRCTGYNSNGQLGIGITGTTTTKKDEEQVAMKGAAQVTVGYYHVASVLASGKAWAVGDNNYGQLADGTNTDRSKAVLMNQVSGIVEIAAGYYHTCVLRKDGTVWCTGYNYNGQLGGGKVGSTYNTKALARVADASCKTDKGCQDDNICTKQQCSLADGLCSVKIQKDLTCDDGNGCTVNGKCDAAGACASAPKDCADDDACTLSPLCTKGICSHTAAVNCDDDNSCTADACDKKTGTCSNTKIAGCIIKCSDDKGCDDKQACTVDKCVSGGCQFTAGNDGALCGAAKACDKGACAPVTTKGWAKQLSMHAYGRHACVLKNDGTVACWGYNNNGQLGDGTTTTQKTPVAVAGLKDVLLVEAGYYSTCAVLKDTTVKCWGDNYYSQLGNGLTTDSKTPVVVKGLTGVTGLAASAYGMCAIQNGGKVACWGRNYDGEMGTGTTGQYQKEPKDTGLSQVVSLSGGYAHFCAVKGDGSTWCWGANTYQQAVPGTSTVDVTKPAQVKDMPKALSVSTSAYASCVVTTSGTVKCIGRNYDGELGIGATTPSDSGEKIYDALAISSAVQLAGTYYGFGGVDGTGSLWSWGDNDNYQAGGLTTADVLKPTKQGSPKGILQVEGGSDTICVLLKSGSVWCRGDNYYGTIGINTTTDSKTFQRVIDANCKADLDCNLGSACFANTCAAATGLCTTVVKSGATCDDGMPCTVSDACDAKGVCVAKAKDCNDTDECTNQPSCDEKTGTCSQLGKVNCDDSNPCTADSCDVKTGKCSSTAITGCKWTCKADADCNDGKPCTVDKCLATSGVCEQKPGNDGAICGAASVCASGACGALTKGFAVQIASGSYAYHTCALRPNGRVWCWGQNSDGQIGDGTTTARSKPTQVADLADVASIATGTYHTCAVQTSGRVKCWGRNSDGQVGNGTASSTDLKKPVEVAGLKDVSSVSAGSSHTCALKTDGTVWCWGYNSDGQIGNGVASYTDVPKPTQAKGVADAIQISVGGNFSCALIKGGAVMCWGYNYYKMFAPSTADVPTPVVAKGYPALTSIEAGHYTLTGITAGKVAWASGFNSYGLTGNGNTTSVSVPTAITAAGNNLVAMSAGYYLSYFLDATGQVWSVGYNLYGALGDGTTTNNLKVQKVVGGTDVVQIMPHYRGGCFLKKDGAVWCIGYGSNGQMGNGTTTSTNKALVKVTIPAP